MDKITDRKKITLTSLLLVVFFIGLPNFAIAHSGPDVFWAPGDPIVHCGGVDSGGNNQPECGFCDLFHVLRHIIDLVLIFVTPVVGTLFFIVAGVMMMLGGDNPGMLARGKSIFKSTFIGILIIFMAFLITNTLLQTLAEPGRVGEGGNWWQFNCDTST